MTPLWQTYEAISMLILILILRYASSKRVFR